MATAQAAARKPTGTAAVAQRVIRQGGGKPAPSDTVNAKLTPGETVIPKELSEEALAPLVALYQQQGHLTQQDIERFLYPILQNLEAGEEGMSGGGRVGFVEGGEVPYHIRNINQQAQAAYDAAPKSASTQWVSGNAQGPSNMLVPKTGGTSLAAPPANPNLSTGMVGKEMVAAPKAPVYTAPAPNTINVPPGGFSPEPVYDPAFKANADAQAAKMQAAKANLGNSGMGGNAPPYGPPAELNIPGQSARSLPLTGVAAKVLGGVGAMLYSPNVGEGSDVVPGASAMPVGDAPNRHPELPTLTSQQRESQLLQQQPESTIARAMRGEVQPKQSVADVAAKAAGTPVNQPTESPVATSTKPNPQPDPVGDALLGSQPTVPQQAGSMGNKRVGYNVDGQGGVEKVVNGKVAPVNTALNILPSGANLQPGSAPERAMAAVNAMKGDSFLGKQGQATAAQKAALYNGLMNAGQEGEAQPQGVAQVARRMATASAPTETQRWNDSLSGTSRIVKDLQDRLWMNNKRSTANALAEMQQVQNTQDRTQMEAGLGQDRLDAELQGHQLAADAAHEKNMVDAQGNQISAVERLANIAKGGGKERQENLQANMQDAIVNAKTPEEASAILQKYQAMFGSNKPASEANWTDVEINDGVDELGNPKTKKIRMNRKTGETAALNIPGQQQDPYASAKAAIAKGADKKAVNARLKAAGLQEIP